MDSEQRVARPGELCTCGRAAVTVFISEEYGEVGYCGIEGSAANPVLPCPWCSSVEPHKQSWGDPAKCPEYQIRPPDPETTQPRAERIRQVVGDRQIPGIREDRLRGILSRWQLPTSLEYALIAEATGKTVLWLLNGVDEDIVDDTTSDEALLLKGIAERHQPPLTLDQARERLQRGGKRYREILDRSHKAISEALNKHFETVMDRDSYEYNQEMAEKLKRHEVTPLMVRIANDYWHDRYNEASNAAWEAASGGANLLTAAHYARMAVYEYAWPGNQDEIIKFGFNYREPTT